MTSENPNPSDTLTLAQRFHRSPDDDSIWYVGRSNNGKTLAPEWVCSQAIAYFAMTRSRGHRELIYLLRFPDPGGCMHKIKIKAAHLTWRATIERLLNAGLRVNTSANAGLFVKFVMATAVECDASRLELQ